MLDPNKYDTPSTKSMTRFLEKEAPHRVTGLSIEPDGVFIYTESAKWCDDAGAGTFRADSETAAIALFYEMVQPLLRCVIDSTLDLDIKFESKMVVMAKSYFL